MRRHKLIAFLGPSLGSAEARRAAPRCELRPPARQGDVWRALESRPLAIALIDGVFESSPSVWHHELRAAIDSGVAVFGAASMGAIRAAELGRFGMIGVGSIHQQFLTQADLDDSHVALLHADAEHAFRPLTVPMVTVLAASGQARAARVLRRAQAQALVRSARELHYQNRTWPRLLQLAAWPLPERERFRAWLKERFEDPKAADAWACLQLAASFVASKAPAPRAEPSNPSSFVRRERLLAVHGDWLGARLARADEVTDQGTRTSLLAAWGRSLGLRAEPAVLARFMRSLNHVADLAERQRLAEIFAVEAVMLKHPERLLPDGPSRLEGLFTQLVRRGRPTHS